MASSWTLLILAYQEWRIRKLKDAERFHAQVFYDFARSVITTLEVTDAKLTKAGRISSDRPITGIRRNIEQITAITKSAKPDED